MYLALGLLLSQGWVYTCGRNTEQVEGLRCCCCESRNGIRKWQNKDKPE